MEISSILHCQIKVFEIISIFGVDKITHFIDFEGKKYEKIINSPSLRMFFFGGGVGWEQ